MVYICFFDGEEPILQSSWPITINGLRRVQSHRSDSAVYIGLTTRSMSPEISKVLNTCDSKTSHAAPLSTLDRDYSASACSVSMHTIRS